MLLPYHRGSPLQPSPHSPGSGCWLLTPSGRKSIIIKMASPTIGKIGDFYELKDDLGKWVGVPFDGRVGRTESGDDGGSPSVSAAETPTLWSRWTWILMRWPLTYCSRYDLCSALMYWRFGFSCGTICAIINTVIMCYCGGYILRALYIFVLFV